MFIRTKTTQGRTYLQVAESYWQDGKPRQRVIATLGRLDKLTESGQVDGIMRSLSRFSSKVKITEEYREGKLEAKKVTKIGLDLVMGRLWSELGIGQAISGLTSERKFEFSVERAVWLATLACLFFPGSDISTERGARDYRTSGAEEISLHYLYQAMSWLGDNREALEDKLFACSRDLFTQLSVAFFDATTLYFEGAGGQELGARGCSKDRKPDENQMILGMVLDQDGRPISAPAWPGNTTDDRTIGPVAESLKHRFGVDKVTLVADGGMVGKKNIEEIEKLGFSYILGVKMRLEKKMAAEVLSRAGRYKEVAENLKVKEVVHAGKRYIVCQNPAEAEHDRTSREAMVADIERKIAGSPSSLVGNSGYRRYLKRGSRPEIDWAKVRQEEKYDGRWVLITNTDLPSEEVALCYKELWRVERTFREAKATLATRSIYHQSDSYILGHVFVSFLALLLMHELKRRTESQFEWDQVVRDLEALYEVEVDQDGKLWRLRSPLQGIAGKVFKAAGVAVPPSAREAKPNATALF
jgi:transposase